MGKLVVNRLTTVRDKEEQGQSVCRPEAGQLMRGYVQQVLRICEYRLPDCRHLLRKPLDALQEFCLSVLRVCSPTGVVVNLLSGMRTPVIDVPRLPRHDRCQVLERKRARFGQQTVLARDKIFDPQAALAEVTRSVDCYPLRMRNLISRRVEESHRAKES